jgi:hypothetical protein
MTSSVDGDIEGTSMMGSRERVVYFSTMTHARDGINVDVRGRLLHMCDAKIAVKVAIWVKYGQTGSKTPKH